MSFQTEVLPFIQNTELCVRELKTMGLLARSLDCLECRNPMNWTKYAKSKDGFGWKCQNPACEKYKYYVSIRTGSFFAQSNIPLTKWLHLIYLWSIETPNKQTRLHTEISEPSIVNAFACLREICDRWLQEHPIRPGGPGVIAQADESAFSKHQSTIEEELLKQLYGCLALLTRAPPQRRATWK